MDSEIKKYIFEKLPYSKPFRFVDDIIEVNDQLISGLYTYKSDEYFYEGHFTGNPITPGVILIETMGQIGLTCLAIYLLKNEKRNYKTILTSVESDFLQVVYPNQTVFITSNKIYFRNNMLKCNIIMKDNQENELVRLSAQMKIIFDE